MTTDNQSSLTPLPEDQPPATERRHFLKWLGLTAVATAASAAGRMAVADASAPRGPSTAQGTGNDTHLPASSSPSLENWLLRMQADLQRAMAKPVAERRWIMVIDQRKCVGCSACTVACKAENQLPPGVVYRPVIQEEIGSYPNVAQRFTPRPCMQCDNPPCVPVCPVGATYKRPDGVVEIDYNACIGCRYCIPPCPYNARTFDSGLYYTRATPEVQAYEQQANFEYGKRYDRAKGSPVGNVRKCTFCLHRLEAGMLPACTSTCIGGATYFGDANDPGSLVSELIGTQGAMRLKEEFGTQPKVYYLM